MPVSFQLLFELQELLSKEIKTVVGLFIITKRCHKSYLELHGFSVSFVAAGKLQVGIVSSVIRGEKKDGVSASSILQVKVVVINTAEKGDDEV